MQRLKKRYVTLVEMMIVMFLIAMITAVVAYNYTGSLEEGKAFKTRAGIDKIHTILDLHLAAHPEDEEHIESDWREIVLTSQLSKGGQELLRDGWGVEYKVSKPREGEIIIESDKYRDYLQKKGRSSLFQEKPHAGR